MAVPAENSQPTPTSNRMSQNVAYPPIPPAMKIALEHAIQKMLGAALIAPERLEIGDPIGEGKIFCIKLTH